jgi:hypothetical protein
MSCVQLIFLTRQNPVDAPARVRLELEQDLGRRHALALLILRELRLADSQDPAELGLAEIKASDLPDSPPYGLQLQGDRFILHRHRRESGIICAIAIRARLGPALESLFMAWRGGTAQ